MGLSPPRSAHGNVLEPRPPAEVESSAAAFVHPLRCESCGRSARLLGLRTCWCCHGGRMDGHRGGRLSPAPRPLAVVIGFFGGPMRRVPPRTARPRGGVSWCALFGAPCLLQHVSPMAFGCQRPSRSLSRRTRRPTALHAGKNVGNLKGCRWLFCWKCVARSGGQRGSISGRQQPPAGRDPIWSSPHVPPHGTLCQHDGPQAQTCLCYAPREQYPLDVMSMEGDVARHEGATIGPDRTLCHRRRGCEMRRGNTLGCGKVRRWRTYQ